MEHGGRIVAKVLKSRGVTHLFTLSGGHLFSIYDGCKEEGIEIVDVRHEQTAVFAAEGFAKATRGARGRGADRRAGRHQRDQRDRRGPGEPLADLRARRPRAGDALGLRVAAGDRSLPCRRARWSSRPRPSRRPGGSRRAPPPPSTWRWPRPRARPSSTTRWTSSSARRRPRCRRRPRRPTRSRPRASRRRRRCSAAAERPGRDGRHRPLLGQGGGRAARARRGASASPSSSTGSVAAACPPITS